MTQIAVNKVDLDTVFITALYNNITSLYIRIILDLFVKPSLVLYKLL